jgi:bacillaene polyketide synthase PksM/BaeM
MIKDQLIFSAKNPVISNHRVYGQALLPGLAYIDLVFQFFRKHGHRFDELRIKDLTIHNPLIVKEDEKVIVSILVKETGPGRWKVEIEGKKMYATAEVLRTEGYASTETMDLGLLRQHAQESYPVADVYARYEAREMSHRGFIRAEGTIYKTGDGLVFDGYPGKEAAPTADQFMFHPTLMDGSAVAMMRLFDTFVGEEENLFLPLYYESFQACALINKDCHAFLPVSSIRRKTDIITFSLDFFDETGKKIGQLTNLTTKQVREGLGPSSAAAPAVHRNNGMAVHEHDSAATGAVTFLKELLGSSLHIDTSSIGMDTEYYNMGFDSVSLLQLASVIGNKIGEELPPTLLFEYPNIGLLAAHLTTTYAQKFA